MSILMVQAVTIPEENVSIAVLVPVCMRICPLKSATWTILLQVHVQAYLCGGLSRIPGRRHELLFLPVKLPGSNCWKNM